MTWINEFMCTLCCKNIWENSPAPISMMHKIEKNARILCSSWFIVTVSNGCCLSVHCLVMGQEGSLLFSCLFRIWLTFQLMWHFKNNFLLTTLLHWKWHGKGCENNQFVVNKWRRFIYLIAISALLLSKFISMIFRQPYFA